MSVLGRVSPFLAALGLTYATWNPSDKGANIVLSGGDLTAATTSSSGGVRSTIGKSSGKWYWEVTVNTAGQTLIGVANSSASLSVYPGSSSGAWTYYCIDGNKYNAGPKGAYGTSYTNGDVIGVALDMDAGTVTLYKNGVSQGVMFSGLTGALYAIVGCSANTSSNTANFGASAFTYTPPAGHSGLGA